MGFVRFAAGLLSKVTSPWIGALMQPVWGEMDVGDDLIDEVELRGSEIRAGLCRGQILPVNISNSVLVTPERTKTVRSSFLRLGAVHRKALWCIGYMAYVSRQVLAISSNCSANPS